MKPLMCDRPQSPSAKLSLVGPTKATVFLTTKSSQARVPDLTSIPIMGREEWLAAALC